MVKQTDAEFFTEIKTLMEDAARGDEWARLTRMPSNARFVLDPIADVPRLIRMVEERDKVIEALAGKPPGPAEAIRANTAKLAEPLTPIDHTLSRMIEDQKALLHDFYEDFKRRVRDNATSTKDEDAK